MKLKPLFAILKQQSPQTRNLSFKKILTWQASLIKPKPQNPPFKHIIQIGDPSLRTICKPVPLEDIETDEIQKLIVYLKYVCKRYNCYGLSAPQIGVPLRIFTMGLSKKSLKRDFSPKEIEIKGIEAVETSVIINPIMKITDNKTVIVEEACESVKGFRADVPRYIAINLKGLNEFGESFEMNATGFTARIIQHEMDHLDGKLYTDIMDKRSLNCPHWQVINERRGKVELPYGPE